MRPMKALVVLIFVLLGSQFYSQDLPKIYKKLKKGNKRSYLKKMKMNAAKEKKNYSLEHYAVALKYDYKFEQSKRIFERLISEDRLSDIGKIEYAGVLMKSYNYDRAISILSLIKDESFENSRHQKMKIIAELLKENNCVEFKKGEKIYEGYCYTFDATASMDPVLPHLSYTWVFNDEIEMKGHVVDHCFNISGTHYITLSSHDDHNGIKNQDTTFTISIPPPVNYSEMEKNNFINTSISFSSSEDPMENASILWHFGNGIYSSGKQTYFNYNRGGNYYIEFFQVPMTMARSSLKCNSYQLFIEQNKNAKKIE